MAKNKYHFSLTFLASDEHLSFINSLFKYQVSFTEGLGIALLRKLT